MNASFKLGQIWGIPIGLHISWFLVFALVLFSLSTGYFPAEYPQLSTGSHFGLAAITTVLLFGSVLLHELGHALSPCATASRSKASPCSSSAAWRRSRVSPRRPAQNFALPSPGRWSAWRWPAVWRAVPDRPAASRCWRRRASTCAAEPDAGAVQHDPRLPAGWRDACCARSSGVSPAARRAPRASLRSAGRWWLSALSAWASSACLTGNFVNGLWLIFIGWFLQNAAASANQQVNVQQKLRGVTVYQAMDRDLAVVAPLTPLNQVVEERVLQRGELAFFVVDYDGSLSGLITLQDITRIPQAQWRYRTVGQVMVPMQQLLQVEAGAELLAALQMMEENGATPCRGGAGRPPGWPALTRTGLALSTGCEQNSGYNCTSAIQLRMWLEFQSTRDDRELAARSTSMPPVLKPGGMLHKSRRNNGRLVQAID